MHFFAVMPDPSVSVNVRISTKVREEEDSETVTHSCTFLHSSESQYSSSPPRY